MVTGFSGVLPPTFFECLPHVQRLVACNIELAALPSEALQRLSLPLAFHTTSLAVPGSASTTCYVDVVHGVTTGDWQVSISLVSLRK